MRWFLLWFSALVAAFPASARSSDRPGSFAGSVGIDVCLGGVDTVGGTSYDWQEAGPAKRYLVNSPEHGLHVTWVYSADAQNTAFPDRNTGYNFYDYTTKRWNWTDPDFMQSGVRVFTERVGYGNLAVDPRTAVAVIPCHLGTPLHIEVARDIAPGAGVFEYCDGRPEMDGYLWPVIGTDSAARIHCACIGDVGNRDSLFCGRCTSWCNWAEPTCVCPPQPDPLYPDHNLAASRVSDRVCLTWVHSPPGYSQKPGFYRVSSDGGATWGPSTQLPYPPAFGGDTLTSFSVWSLFPFIDRRDVLHIVASVCPFLRDTNYITPCEIWHWCEANQPRWHEVHRADPESLLAPVGYNATIACRPSVGEDNGGNLFAAWEEFDGVNAQQHPSFLRADIWLAASTCRGQEWEPAIRITGPGAPVSYRFPCIVDLATEGSGVDTVTVRYMVDKVAGFFVQGEHNPGTYNPIVVHSVLFSGLRERAREPRTVRGRKPTATILRGVLRWPGSTGAVMRDVNGRRVARLRRGENDVRYLAQGVYFVTGEDSGTQGPQDSSVKILIRR